MHSLLLSRTTNEAFGIEGLCAKLCVLQKTGTFSEHVKQKVNPNYQSYPFPLSFARSRESKGCFDQGVRGRYPLKPSIFVSLLETKGYQNTVRPDHPESPINVSILA